MVNKKRQESYTKIENESFYTSPPYDYRPSIAEYLTTFNVTKNSFIADIMHLDYKGNIKIIDFNKEFIQIKLLDSSDLDADKLLIWDYLKSLEINKEIRLNIEKIPKRTLSRFRDIVIIKTYEKFGTSLTKNYQEDPNRKFAGLILSRILLGIGFFVINYVFFGFLSLLTFILGIIKLSKEKSDIKYFFKKFVLRYILITILYFALISAFFVLLFFSITYRTNSIIIFVNHNILAFLIIFLLIGIFFFYQYSKILYDYICWLMESKEAGENRRNWLQFKSFVIKNSELEKTPLAHYILWGPFYYYTLAVGGIKNLTISLD